LLERVRATAGVRSATFTTAVPMQTVHIDSSTVAPDGYTLPAARQNVEVMSASVGEEYFSTIQIPIVRGRAFRREDTSQTPPVVIVNELFAQHYWPGEDPVGKRLRVADGRMNGLPAEVVGVSKNSKYVLLVEPPTEYIYFPYRQRPSGYLILLVHSDEEPSGPGGLISRLRGVVRGLEADMPVYDVRTMRDFYQLSSVGLMNMIIGVIAAMGTMGLALSMVGLYGLIAYGASRRTREIGIRIALGAGRGSVLRMVMNQGLLLAMAGLAVGLFASLLAGKLLAATFVGPAADNDHDFTSLLLVGAGVLAVTGLAAYIPARHASRTDPLNALRYE
jgi:putative ABC transport system permease protein